MVNVSQDQFDLERFLPYRLNRAAEWVSLSFAQEYRARYGMTRPEWRTLAALGSLTRVTATEIGQHSGMHKTKVSRAVRALEERRWLRRHQSDDDRRVEYLELTPNGISSYRELVKVARSYEDSLLKLLGQTGGHSLDQGLSAIEAAARNTERALRARFD